MKQAGDQIQNPAWAAKEDEQMVRSFMLARLRSQAEIYLESFEVGSRPWKSNWNYSYLSLSICQCCIFNIQTR